MTAATDNGGGLSLPLSVDNEMITISISISDRTGGGLIYEGGIDNFVWGIDRAVWTVRGFWREGSMLVPDAGLRGHEGALNGISGWGRKLRVM